MRNHFCFVAVMLFASSAALSKSDDIMSVASAHRWLTKNHDGSSIMVSCDSFGPDAEIRDVNFATTCVALSCLGISIMNNTGYNEQVTWRSTRGRVAVEATEYDPKMSAFFGYQTRTVWWSRYVKIMNDFGSPPFERLRFSLDLLPTAKTEPVLYNFKIDSVAKDKFGHCAR